jgi:putative FmdB family regulatory protein
MPNYDYQCERCGHQFEVFQSMNDPKLEDCPQDACAGKVRRLLGTGAGLIFKGSGFYQTDYRSKSYRDGHRSESGASKGDSGGGKDKKAAGGSKSGGCGSGCGCHS